jgi:hypothetical protein
MRLDPRQSLFFYRALATLLAIADHSADDLHGSSLTDFKVTQYPYRADCRSLLD